MNLVFIGLISAACAGEADEIWIICDHWLQNCDHKGKKSLMRDKIPHLLAPPLRDTAAQMFKKVKIDTAS